ncbi:MAG TPA: 2-succinyl-5-enolpyruvyl-6-hydroxy-3-cyclohexene-1-carboxylic-acid synthase [Phycisphaerales bacterium]|nr:2-succinyl-5-enolpyruvyl-6-hydroxy-3-cyclohexene-1-carboxylic-acid synthase [Phycisphaerales bacterium]
MPMPANLNTLQAEIIVEELVRYGIDTFCISPGSRSTPLVAAVARNRRARVMMFYDERGSAFYALGYGRATTRPAAVITTSGTAAANLLPAICEASVDKVPLLVLTADRPPELTDTGANQTLNQAGMFARFVRWDFDFPCPCEPMGAQAVLTTVDHAVSRSVGIYPGPVHLNCRFREPLEPMQGADETVYTARIGRWRDSREPFTRYEPACAAVDPAVVESIAQTIGDAQRLMVVVGGLRTDRQQTAVRQLVAKLRCPVYADIVSGLRLGGCGTNLIRHYDPQLLGADFNRQARPDVVLHIGGRTTSKRVGQFFDTNRPRSYIVIKQDPDRYDPVHAVTRHVQTDVAGFCESLAEYIESRDEGAFWRFYRNKAEAAHAIIERHIAAEPGLTEAFVARHLSREVPDGTGLFLSNSMPIRDMDLYADTAAQTVRVGANRGISGIDGVVASACGFAAGLDAPVTAVAGDLAMVHDINSLAIVGRSEPPVIVVTINNRGGGIFDFLDISQYKDVFEPYFVAPHDYSFAGVCETFKVKYQTTTTKQAFADAYRAMVHEGTSGLIEVPTQRAVNLRLRKAIKTAIIEALHTEGE